MPVFWRALLLFCSLELCKGSTSTPNQPSDPIQTPITETNEITCVSYRCVYYFVLYYNQVLLEQNDYQVSSLDYISFSYSITYFLHKQYTPVNLIKEAFEYCKGLHHNTLDDCEEFFNDFYKKSYPIHEIPRICTAHFSVCENPREKLILNYDQENTLQIDNLNFDDCWDLISLDNKQIIYDNTTYARWVRIYTWYDKTYTNICSCRQVHAIANLFRALKEQKGIITEYYCPSEYTNILTTTCVFQTIVSSKPYWWSLDEIDTIGKTLAMYEGSQGNGVEIARLILAYDQTFIPALRRIVGRWTLAGLIDTFYKFQVDSQYFETAIDLMSLGAVHMASFEDFQEFLQTSKEAFDSVNRQLVIPLSEHYYRAKLLECTMSLMQIISVDYEKLVYSLLKSQVSTGQPMFSTISDFILYYYNLVANK